MAQTPAEAATYTPLFLLSYDIMVLYLFNLLIWKCPTRTVLRPLFTSALGKRHLDLGVGTGYFPSKALVSPSCPCREITLVDLNPTPLEVSRRRILQTAPSTRVVAVVADATLPLPLPSDSKFDSISAFYLLHCLAGPADRKNRVFDVARHHLAPDGVFVGATLLPLRKRMGWIARLLLTFLTWHGVLSNDEDKEEVFAQGLRRNFADVDIWIVGVAMCWRATGPRGP
ncbi:Methyltransferase type 12 [Metarhizium rileyi]|uniref:Methyltransferase type 12 n=1 Tax=Metarhizium rileyi (strain RCEF 4871) TaxID=1649241 RepID=A0A166Y323_METRR|nr:Methyltransferase type 12 [Metarhizium rileyi RCEF 4871]TWU70839.1 hypothetical protein ED733_001330 [Metarhizium rileyi]